MGVLYPGFGLRHMDAVCGVTHLLISALLYAPGTILYVIARREQKGKIFPRPADKITFVFLIAMALLSAYLLTKGEISI